MSHIKHLEIFMTEYQNTLNKIDLLRKENETLKEYILELSKQIRDYQESKQQFHLSEALEPSH